MSNKKERATLKPLDKTPVVSTTTKKKTSRKTVLDAVEPTSKPPVQPSKQVKVLDKKTFRQKYEEELESQELRHTQALLAQKESLRNYEEEVSVWCKKERDAIKAELQAERLKMNT